MIVWGGRDNGGGYSDNNVGIYYTYNTYTVGGSVTGLAAGNRVVLQNNGLDNLAINADGGFTFATALDDGSTYVVTVLTQPNNQICSVSSGTGMISGADVTDISVSCAANTHTVTPYAGPNGSIAPSTPQVVNHGNATPFTVIPDDGYTAVVGGTCGGTLVGDTYTTNAIIADCTVDATFILNTYTVTPFTGANGTIAPSTPQVVNHGSTTTFTVTADDGYTAYIGGTCGGTLVDETYTTNAIIADCIVLVAFSEFNMYAVNATAGRHGTIFPSGIIYVDNGEIINFTLTADDGYTAVVGGTCGGTFVGDTYTTNAIIADCTVDATFILNTYTVTPFTGANGTIAPSTPQVVNHGSTTTFTVTADDGYTAVVGGTCGGTLVDDTYTTNAVITDCTVDATFTLKTYTVTPLAGANGSVTPSTPQIINHGSTTIFTVTADDGYTAYIGGTCGGTLVDDTYTTNVIITDCEVSATFTAKSDFPWTMFLPAIILKQ